MFVFYSIFFLLDTHLYIFFKDKMPIPAPYSNYHSLQITLSPVWTGLKVIIFFHRMQTQVVPGSPGNQGQQISTILQTYLDRQKGACPFVTCQCFSYVTHQAQKAQIIFLSRTSDSFNPKHHQIITTLSKYIVYTYL